MFLSTSDAINSVVDGQHHTLDSINCVIKFVHSKEDLKLGDPGSKVHSTFFYEICPLYTVASFLKAKYLSFSGKSHSFDGNLYLSDNYTHKIECVRAGGVFGSRKNYFLNERHRIKHLQLHKRAPAFGIINVDKKTKKIEEQPSLAQKINLSAQRRALYCNLTRAFCEKQTTGKYESMWLIISIDDWYPPLKEAPFKFFSSIQKFWEAVKDNHTFERVFIVGESLGPIFWDSSQPHELQCLNQNFLDL